MLDITHRPKQFRDVLGNSGVKRLLLTRAKNRTLGHQSMMFGGPKGCGKTTMARLVARALLCGALVDGEPCGECAPCVDILNEVHPDVEELDAASQGTVDKIRSMVRDVDYETISPYRIYILDEAQRLSAAAQDALLKAVEDRMFVVILCTTEPHKIREPIRSRVEEYPIQPPDSDEMLNRMNAICQKERIVAEEEALRVIVRMHRTCPRLCLLSLNSLASVGDVTVSATQEFFRFNSYECIVNLLAHVNTDLTKSISLLDELSTRETPSWIRDNMVYAISSAVREDIGVKSQYPVAVQSIVPLSKNLVQLANKLGALDKILLVDIEISLLDHVMPHQSVKIVEKVEVVKPTSVEPKSISTSKFESEPNHKPESELPESEPLVLEPKITESEPVKSNSSIEIDGVKFSDQEELTSLDKKIGMADRDKPKKEKIAVSVQLDEDNVPITEKQFVDGFLGKIRRS
jgi:DNA polymerase III subunit gamma/tau